MLEKTNRLRSDKTIVKTLRIGRRINTSAYSLVAAKSSSAVTKVAVVVGTKIDKRAVVRNRLKRRTREAVRTLLPSLLPGFDVILFPRLIVETMPYGQLQKDLEDLFLKARLLI